MNKIWSCILVAMLMAVGCGSSDAACTGSSPTWTCGPTYTELDNLINVATPPGFTRNDRVNVTAGDGTETWTGALVLTKGIQLMGPGRNALIIDRTETLFSIMPDATAIANEETIKVDGFTLSANNGSITHIMFVQGEVYTGTKPFKNLIVTNNRFKDLASGRAIWISRQVRGVISGNIFDRVAAIISPFGSNDRTEWEVGNFPFAFGSLDNLYFEDNSFTCSTTDATDPIGWLESGQGGRVVVRYNTWDFANCTSGTLIEAWDIHGFQNYTGSPAWPNNGQSGTMVTEYYGNTITNMAGNRWMNFRGSQSVIHNNITTGSGGAVMHLSQYDRGCDSFVNSTWPAPHGEINTVYGFNNTVNGTAKRLEILPPVGDPGPGQGNAINLTCPPVEDDATTTYANGFWNYNAACTSSSCTSGIGRGTTAPTGTCTKGTGYWVASTATPTVSSAVIQNGILYKCTATNTWTSYYTPYPYPHPLLGSVATGASRFSHRLYLRRAALDEALLPVRVPDYLHLIDW